MLSPAINIESLPKDKQDKIVEHFKKYIQDLQDEQKMSVLKKIATAYSR